MAVHPISLFGDAFPVWNLWFRCHQTDLELTFSSADGHVNVLIAHPLQDRLACGMFLEPGKRHVLFAQTGEGWADLGSIGLCLGFDRHPVKRIRVFGSWQGQWMTLVTQGVAGGGDT